MNAARTGWTVVFALAVTAAGPLLADTVVLGNGTRLTGDVRVGPHSVRIRSASGELVVPIKRVLRVESAAVEPQEAQPAPAPAGKPEAPEGAAGTSPAAATPAVGAKEAGPGAPNVGDVLASRIDVDFQGMSVADVLVYVHELTGVNLALAPEVQTATAPVSLHLKGVRVEEVLKLALEPAGLSYSVRPGGVLYVHAAGAGDEWTMRVYPVADLLVSTEDHQGGGQVSLGGGTGTAGGGSLGTATRGGGGRGGGRGGGLNPQYGGRQGGAQLQTGRGAAAGSRTISPLTARAENLILLIKSACGRGTWEDPTDAGRIEAANGG